MVIAVLSYTFLELKKCHYIVCIPVCNTSAVALSLLAIMFMFFFYFKKPALSTIMLQKTNIRQSLNKAIVIITRKKHYHIDKNLSCSIISFAYLYRVSNISCLCLGNFINWRISKWLNEGERKVAKFNVEQ